MTTGSQLRSRRAFVLPTVLAVLVILAILCGSMALRTGASNQLIVDELNGYREHHDMLAARDTAIFMSREFAIRIGRTPPYADFARSRVPIYELVLDDRSTQRFFVYDAQATIHLLPDVRDEIPSPSIGSGRRSTCSRRPSIRSSAALDPWR
ncbi:MAG: hypothetical protein HC927_11300 [Deltaproteobacteria bacterium]|nr:hypothetical protein [Deltaproteobacteria bacterium]